MISKRPWRDSACRICVSAGAFCTLIGVAAASPAPVVVDFEDLTLPLESFYNGADNAGGFSSRGALFNNTYTDFGGGFYAWLGWSYSNVTDNATPGYGNQYSAITGGGADGSENYAVAFAPGAGDATIDLPVGTAPESLAISNSTYAAISMLDGDAYTKQFGGPTGDNPDYFLLTITGLDADDSAVGSVEFYLADYRSEDNALDYIVDTWTEVDLTNLDGATRLSFGLDSSDVGSYGINTPTYFVMDNLRLVPEPATITLMLAGAVAVLRRGRNFVGKGDRRC